MPISEALFISVLFGLAVTAIATEVLRRVAGRSPTSNGQFWFRMFGGGVMLFLVGAITFGALLVRPEDGKVFGWYWTFCAVVLFGLLLIVREDLARTRKGVLGEYRRLRDNHLSDIERLFREHDARAKSPSDDPTPDHPAS